MRFKMFVSGIGWFEGMFALQVKEGSKPHKAIPRYFAYVLQQPFRGE